MTDPTPHPNDKDATIRTLRRRLKRERNYARNTVMLDAMTKAALEAANAEIERLEAENAALREARTLTEGALMGVYMDFDRQAERTWTPSEYLLHFAAAVQTAVLTYSRSSCPTP